MMGIYTESADRTALNMLLVLASLAVAVLVGVLSLAVLLGIVICVIVIIISVHAQIKRTAKA